MARLQDGSIHHHNLYEYMIHNMILQTMKNVSTISEITYRLGYKMAASITIMCMNT